MKKLNNKGITLVELLISIGIFALIMVAAFSVLSVATKTYSKNNDEINSQNEAQTLMNQMDNIISDATTFEASGSTYKLTKKDETGSSTVYNISYLADKVYYYVEGQSAGDENLLAEDVSAFSIDSSNLDDYGYVKVSLEVTKTATEFTASKNVFLRNLSSSKSLAGNVGGGDTPAEESTAAEESAASEETTSPGGSTPVVNPPASEETTASPATPAVTPTTAASGSDWTNAVYTVTLTRKNPSEVDYIGGQLNFASDGYNGGFAAQGEIPYGQKTNTITMTFTKYDYVNKTSGYEPQFAGWNASELNSKIKITYSVSFS